VVQLLEQHFTDLVRYEFTAGMESDLDEIANGQVEREPWLTKFWFGNGTPGLKTLVDRGKEEIDPAAINSILVGADDNGEPVVVKPGRYGPYVKRGDDTASVPDDLAPDELTVTKALELLAAPSGEKILGTDPASGLDVIAKAGRFGPYVQLGEMPEGKVKAEDRPKTASLFKTMTLDTISVDEALKLLALPRVVGVDPADGQEILAQNGRYGPYLKKGTDTRSLEAESDIFDVSLDRALQILAEPKRRRGQTSAAPLRELGNDPVSGKPMVVKDGRFGPYVTDGETNASLRKGDDVDSISDDRASELLQMRREAAPVKKRGTKKAAAKKTGAKKAGTKKKTATKKAAAKKSAAGDPPAG